MKPEYDFSKGERGKFSRPNAELRLPIYLRATIIIKKAVHIIQAVRAKQVDS